jgi:hypothetical protein
VKCVALTRSKVLYVSGLLMLAVSWRYYELKRNKPMLIAWQPSESCNESETIFDYSQNGGRNDG